jgi:DNA-binding beta-propeller fold protein YncE
MRCYAASFPSKDPVDPSRNALAQENLVDGERFDALTRALGFPGSRRQALFAGLAAIAGLFGTTAPTSSKRKQGRESDEGKNRHRRSNGKKARALHHGEVDNKTTSRAAEPAVCPPTCTGAGCADANPPCQYCGTWSAESMCRKAPCPCDPPTGPGIKAPVLGRMRLVNYNGYDSDANNSNCVQKPGNLDHCENQLYGLDLDPTDRSDKGLTMVSPIDGEIVRWNSEAGCLFIRLKDPDPVYGNVYLSLCHFAQPLKTSGTVRRGECLGRRSEGIHISLATKPDDKSGTALPFTGRYHFEGRSLCPNGTKNQWFGDCGGHLPDYPSFVSSNLATCKMECPTGQKGCNGACVDTKTDAGNCGKCGRVCPAPRSCVRGKCVCPTGLTYCAGSNTCVDTMSDPANCRGCGKVCAHPGTCVRGTCVCPAGHAYCTETGTCVDTTSDPSNCGRCGKACDPGVACEASRCKTENGSAGGYEFVTKWGPWGSGDGQIQYPGGIAAGSSGHVYVADGANPRIQKFTTDGQFVTTWASAATGAGQFGSADGIAVDGHGNVYVVDDGNNWIQKFTSSGGFLTKWGTFGDGDGQFRYPNAIAVDGADNVYVVDAGNDRIQKFTSDGTFVTKWGSEGTGAGQFHAIGGVAADSAGNVYVVDYFIGDEATESARVQKFTSSGTFIKQWGSPGSSNGQFLQPTGIAVDADGNVYVVDVMNHRVQKFTSDGAFLTKWGSEGSRNGQFYHPWQVAVDGVGNVYVLDDSDFRIQKFAPVADRQRVKSHRRNERDGQGNGKARRPHRQATTKGVGD